MQSSTPMRQIDLPSPIHSFNFPIMLKTDYTTVQNFFTEDEWNAIDSALADYQDYGQKETEFMNSIGDKLYALFNPKFQDENRHPNSGAN